MTIEALGEDKDKLVRTPERKITKPDPDLGFLRKRLPGYEDEFLVRPFRRVLVRKGVRYWGIRGHGEAAIVALTGKQGETKATLVERVSLEEGIVPEIMKRGKRAIKRRGFGIGWEAASDAPEVIPLPNRKDLTQVWVEIEVGKENGVRGNVGFRVSRQDGDRIRVRYAGMYASTPVNSDPRMRGKSLEQAFEMIGPGMGKDLLVPPLLRALTGGSQI
ncbi:MAG: hypothetical protein Q8N98_03135 [bacterium]|nr:hypothetical protein [bacterium]